MANTLLQTGRTLTANNVQPNPNQTAPIPQATQTPINSNVNGTQGINQPTVNPITIPIQIQPQIAQTPQVQTTQSNQTQNVQNLQTNNNQQVSAPTPQEYKAPTNNNQIDFNQIYSSYQSRYGTNVAAQNQNSSGIKRTTFNTPIATPTAPANTVEGQYQSAYADTINGLVSELLSRQSTGFQYDPTNDTSLRLASEYAANSAMEQMAARGILNSSSTAERVASVVSQLIPEYEKLAYTRWTDATTMLINTANLVMNYDTQQFNQWKDAKDREFDREKFNYQKEQDSLTNAWKRVDELGYVDNGASQILGVPVGTLSGEARRAKEEREFQLRKMREQAEIEYANNKALYELRNQLDLERQQKLNEQEYSLKQQYAKYENELSKDNTAYKYQLEQKYGTSKSSSKNSNYSNYDEIIKNRYAKYNKNTQQYTVSGEKNYQNMRNYLRNVYASGGLNDDEYSRLLAKYSTYSSVDQSSVAKEENGVKYIDNKTIETLRKEIDKGRRLNNNSLRTALGNAYNSIENGNYEYSSYDQFVNDVVNGKFGSVKRGF